MPTSFKNQFVVITGGSSGIGFELARLFLKEEARVVLVASGAARLADAAAALDKEFKIPVLAISKDLSAPGAAKSLFDDLTAKLIPVDVLVNNAGFGIGGNFSESQFQKAMQMVQLNVNALSELTHLCLPGMIERKRGGVLNVASTAGFQGIPTEALYAATKAFVLAFSEGISEELKSTGVIMSCLCPGPTETDFFKRGTIKASHGMLRTMMKTEDVAKIGFEAFKKGKPVAIAGLRNKALVQGQRLIPRQLAVKIAGKFVKAKHS